MSIYKITRRPDMTLFVFEEHLGRTAWFEFPVGSRQPRCMNCLLNDKTTKRCLAQNKTFQTYTAQLFKCPLVEIYSYNRKPKEPSLVECVFPGLSEVIKK